MAKNIMKSLSKIVIFILTLFFYSAASGSDYSLWVVDIGSPNCAPPMASRNDDLWNPIRTSDEVIQDLQRYFSSEKIKIPILVAAFTNGHIEYCSITSRRKVYESLIEILTWPEISNIKDLYDFISLSSNKRMLNIIDQKIEENKDKIKIVSRLKKAKKLVGKTLNNLSI